MRRVALVGAGVSKFGVRNRARRAFVDLLVVRWMQGSALRYVVEPEEGRGGQG